MSRAVVAPATEGLAGALSVPGDKSIGHRAVLLGAVARGTTKIRGLPDGADVRSSLSVVAALGAGLREGEPGVVAIEGVGGRFTVPAAPLDCGNSGTTMRLVTGLLAGAGIDARLVGDASLSRRPMERVAEPLRAMGARVTTTKGCAPILVSPAPLLGRRHELAVASAQVKSALLLAGSFADGTTTVVEPAPTRDHSERMLTAMGAPLRCAGTEVSIDGPVVLEAVDLDVPGDPSSAAFWLVAAVLAPNSDVEVRGVCLNQGRIGFVDVLRRMGAAIDVRVEAEAGGEPVGSIRARSSRLTAVELTGVDVPACIDEIPLLAVAAAAATGTTRIRGAGELRVKESDRIATTASLVEALGASVQTFEDGLEIVGSRLAGGACIDAAGDHRIAMAAAVGGLASTDAMTIDGAEAAAVSYPGFFDAIDGLRR